MQDSVRENLSALRNEAKNKAAQYHEDAIEALHDAMNSPVYTTAQVNAAKALLTFAFGEKEAADTSVNFQVNVQTNLGDEALEQQQRRHSKAIDGEFRVAPVE